MSKKMRVFLTAVCALAFVTSAGVTAFLAILTDPSRLAFGEWLAPVNINIELDKNFINNISVLSEPREAYYYLSPTSAPAGEQVVIHTELRSSGFHRKLFLRLPKEHAETTLNTVDNISVFIGNKVYYFTGDEVQQFAKTEKDGYALFRFPEMYYAKSLVVKDWVNYYGDFNIALKIFCAFLFQPGRFFISWLFLATMLFLYRKEAFQKYHELRGKKYAAALLLAAVTILGFLLRINGFIRHSAWLDELYCTTLAGNPNAPFLSVFMDNGNPPFYFLLLKYWFKLVGWNEAAGTLLSVLLGTAAIPALYLFLKEQSGKAVALASALILAISAFAIGYSQAMRACILLILLTPLVSLFLLRTVKKPSAVNHALYAFFSILAVNTFYYGILLVMANFAFYCGYCYLHKRRIVYVIKFLALNVVIALSLMPIFFYKIFVDHYDFSRDYTALRPDYILIFMLIALVIIAAFIKRKEIADSSFIKDEKKTGCMYVLSMPALIFVFCFLVSLVKPLISYDYLGRINYPFLISIPVIIFLSFRKKNMKRCAVSFLLVWLVCGSVYKGDGRLDISGTGYGYYREGLRYITLDAQAHTGIKAVMLNNAPDSLAYYHEPELPLYSPDAGLIYVFDNDYYHSMDEWEMYDALFAAGLDDANMLKIILSEKSVLFKIYAEGGKRGVD